MIKDNYLNTFTELEAEETVILFSVEQNIDASMSFSIFLIAFELKTFNVTNFEQKGFALYSNPIANNKA